jgi:hypothetical protein
MNEYPLYDDTVKRIADKVYDAAIKRDVLKNKVRDEYYKKRDYPFG